MFDVLIVGAGLSGLTTAYKILQKEPSLKLKILEASNRIGGQIAAIPDRVTGGKWIVPEQCHVHNLLAELKIPMRRRNPVSRDHQRSWPIDVGPFAVISKYELQRYIDDLDLQSLLFRSGTYELKPKDREYSMWHHIRGKLFFQSSRIFMMNLVRLVAGVDAKDVCYVEFMNVLHSCGGLKALVNLYIEPSSAQLEFPSEHVLEALVTILEPIVLEKMSKVVDIQHDEDFVQVRDINGGVHSATVVVLAIPWNHIVDIFITPPIPAHMDVPYTSRKYYITSFLVQYAEAHWRRKGLSGNIYTSEPTMYTHQYKPTSLAGYILHEEGFEVLGKSVVLKTLATHFGNEMSDPVHYNQQTFEQTSLLNLPQTVPWNRIIWSSSSTATLYRGCLNGAVQSGLRSALNALMILRPQKVTWQDMVEVQRANVVYRYPGCWDLLKSSLNIYNTVFYTVSGLAVYYMIKNRNKLLNLS